MAIIWNKIIPRWGGDTMEPPEAKKDVGYIAGDNPPAKWENWLRKGTYEALDETRDVIESIDSQMAQKPSMTTAPITLYVSTSGNDSNDGLTPATALRNIQTAIDKIPQVVNHQVFIVLSAGTYSEDILISGFAGEGQFQILGGSALTNNYVVRKISLVSNSCDLVIKGVNASTTTTSGIEIFNCSSAGLGFCSIPLSSGFAGIVVSNSKAFIENCNIANRAKGIFGFQLAHIVSQNNTGIGNVVALESVSGSVIAKNGTQPTGTTNEATFAGGVIR